MLRFLETDIREQIKYEKINRHLWIIQQIKFENRVKDKNNFFIKQNIAFLF